MSIFNKNKSRPFDNDQCNQLHTIVSMENSVAREKISSDMRDVSVSLSLKIDLLRNEILSIASQISDIKTSLKGIRYIIDPVLQENSLKVTDRLAERQNTFEKTRKALSDHEKAAICDRLFAEVYQEAKTRRYHTFTDEEEDLAYENLLDKYGVQKNSNRPGAELDVDCSRKVETPVKVPGADTLVKDDKKENVAEKQKKAKTKTKKGDKNGKKPGRNRKAKTAGSRNAVSTDKKLADGQG